MIPEKNEAYQSMIGILDRLRKRQDQYGNENIPQDELNEELQALGAQLYRDILPEKMKAIARRLSKLRSLTILGNESWIPWELIKMDGGCDHAAFWGHEVALTRWPFFGHSARSQFRISRIAFVRGADLEVTGSEGRLLEEIFTRQGARMEWLPTGEVKPVRALMDRGGIDLWHFSAHGSSNFIKDKESRICLSENQRYLKPKQIHGRREANLVRDRPFVVMNVCEAAHDPRGFGGMEGWIGAMVDRGRCGGFLGLQLPTSPHLAYHFLAIIYKNLADGETLGRALLAARKETQDVGKGNPAWCGFAAYGHPNARFHIGKSV